MTSSQRRLSKKFFLAARKSDLPAKALAQAGIRKIVDRREAIKTAISSARDGDIVVSTGMGSQDVMRLAKGKTIPWDERAIVEEVLRNKK